MNDSIDRNFHTIYIDKIPIEEQLKGHVYGAWTFMDKADIREWLANDEIKIYNLQSKIDKANDLLQLLHYKFNDDDNIHNEIEDIQKVLKEEK